MSYHKSFMPALMPEAVVGQIADGEVVVATPDSRKALLLNESGAIVLSLCNGRLSIDQIAALFCETLGLEPEQAEADVQRLLAQLAGEGLLLGSDE